MWVWDFLHSAFPDCLFAGFFTEQLNVLLRVKVIELICFKDKAISWIFGG